MLQIMSKYLHLENENKKQWIKKKDKSTEIKLNTEINNLMFSSCKCIN